MTFLYILLFIFCLSTLVMIHELGHLLTAKMFKVYCFEYSIGFGPKLFSFKRKGWETAFSLRAIPFGGFVSMYGEKETLPEGMEEIDPKRSLLSIKKWKRAIIMLAGITMNAILALVLFFTYEMCNISYIGHYAHLLVNQGSQAETAGLKTGDYVGATVFNSTDGSMVFYDNTAILTYEDESVKDVFFGFNYSTITIRDTSLANHAVAYEIKYENDIVVGHSSTTFEEVYNDLYDPNENYLLRGIVYAKGQIVKGETTYLRLILSESYDLYHPIVADIVVTDTNPAILNNIPRGNLIEVVGKITKQEGNYYLSVIDNNFKFSYPDIESGNFMAKKWGELKPTKITFDIDVIDEENHTFTRKSFENDIVFNEASSWGQISTELGISMQLEGFKNNYAQAVKATFEDFGNSSLLIYRTLGSLFTSAETWRDVGGIVAIGVVSTRVLKENGILPYLYLWAMISVNLAIVNLLPFPGLDGWHFLVIIVEGVFKKEIPAKVKNIMMIVGISLLFAFMVAVLIKDIIMFI